MPSSFPRAGWSKHWRSNASDGLTGNQLLGKKGNQLELLSQKGNQQVLLGKKGIADAILTVPFFYPLHGRSSHPKN